MSEENNMMHKMHGNSIDLRGAGVAARRKVVLVVDDSRINREVLCRILRSDGFDTIEAADGQEALEIMQGTGQSIALVLMDIFMPIMDGYSLLQRMNETGLIQKIPVIITTGNDEEGVEIKCLENGASDFMKKPYNSELVRHRVRSLLRLWDNAALLSRLEIDQLTGVYAKEFFYQHAEEKMDVEPNKRYYIIYADVDDFKMINARYGIAAGDELLKYLADVYRKMVGEDGICGRWGADTFIMMLADHPKCTQSEVNEWMLEAFADAPVKGFHVKFGIYSVTDRSVSVSEMCDRAKLAMSSIKHQYGVTYAMYDSSMMQCALRWHQLADCMEKGLEQKQFVVYLQPKHCAQTGTIAGAEALVRWRHPELGFISPGEFIPLFERNGFIAKLDGYMLEEVCRTLRQWRDDGAALLPISVNVSRADFFSGNLPERIAGLVDSYDIPHELVHLEVTESAYTDNPQQIVAAICALRRMGFLIEMDDFGSGYSSLNMLSELPIDILKLDMRFVQGASKAGGDGKRNILSFIMSLSKWLRFPTVAEGVETQEEYDQLRSMGCDLIQGYYFAKPMPINEFETYMGERTVRCSLPKRDEHAVNDDNGFPPIFAARDPEGGTGNHQ